MTSRADIRFDETLLKEFRGEGAGGEEREYFDLHRRRYAETVQALERLRPATPDAKRPRLLDVGGFPGHIAYAACRLGWDVEIATEPLDKFPPYEAFRRACDRHGLPVRTLDVEREFFPCDGETFDAVLFAEVLEHLAHNPFHTLGEICRVLKPDGALILTTPNLASAARIVALLYQHPISEPLTSPWSGVFPTAPTKRHVREYTATEVRHLLVEQNKDVYRFDRVVVGFTDSWREQENPAGRAIGAFAPLLRRLGGRWQGNILATARKPGNLYLVPVADCGLEEGFYDVEPPFAPRNMPFDSPYPVRWISGRAELRMPLPAGVRERLRSGGRVRVTLPLRNPLPSGHMNPRSVGLCQDGRSVAESRAIEYSPDLAGMEGEFTIEPGTASLQIGIVADTFCPDDSLQPGDKRKLSVQLVVSRISLEIMTSDGVCD